MTLKWILAGTMLASSAVLAPAVSAEKVTLWTFLNPTGNAGREVALKTLIDAYEAANPGTEIVVEPQVWSELTQKFVLGANLNRAPDIVFTHGNSLRLLAESGAAADLDALITAKWSADETADFLYDGLLDKARIDGKLLGVPVFPFASVMFYRKDLLEAAGKTPEDLATWDGYVEAMQAVATDQITATSVPLSPEKTTQSPALTYLLDTQGKVFDEACKPLLNTQQAQDAMAFQVGLYDIAGFTSREDMSRTIEDSWDMFLAGRTASVINASTRAGQAVDKASWDAAGLGIAPMPGVKAGTAGPAVANAWYITVWDGSPVKEEAADFVNFMIGAEGAREWALTGGQPPLRGVVQNSDEMAAPENAVLREVGGAISVRTADLPAECRADRVYADLNEATQAVLSGGSSISQALDAAQKAAEERN